MCWLLCCLLIAVYRAVCCLFVVCNVLALACSWLCVVRWLLFAVCRLLCVGWSMLLGDCCWLLLAVC